MGKIVLYGIIFFIAFMAMYYTILYGLSEIYHNRWTELFISIYIAGNMSVYISNKITRFFKIEAESWFNDK